MIHFGGGGPSERSFLPVGGFGGDGDRGGDRGGRLHHHRGTRFVGQEQQGRRLAAAVRVDGDVAARSAALGSLFCEEEDVRGGRSGGVQAKQEKEGKEKDKGKGKK